MTIWTYLHRNALYTLIVRQECSDFDQIQNIDWVLQIATAGVGFKNFTATIPDCKAPTITNIVVFGRTTQNLEKPDGTKNGLGIARD